MQITVKDRETISGATTQYSRPIDVSSMPLFTYNITVHAASSSTTFTVSFETCDNLEDWVTLSGSDNQDTAGTTLGKKQADTDFYGRYVRVKIVTAGTEPVYNTSIWLNTFPSS